MSTSDELAEYLDHWYGTCERGRDCYCLTVERQIKVGMPTGWHGKACPWWRPLGLRSWEDLKKHAIDIYRERD